MNKFLIVTGMSGAGKSSTVAVLEDIGYYCVDNIPPQLIPNFVKICLTTKAKAQLNKVAIVTDIRGGELFYELDSSIDVLKKNNVSVKVLFLNSSDEVLLARFKETRRKHPLDIEANGSLEDAIAMERNILENMQNDADFCIDTSEISVRDLRKTVLEMFTDNDSELMHIEVMSFGTKYGSERDADLVFDVRCLPNPYYIEDLKPRTGLEECVREYVMSFEQSQELEKKLFDLIDFLVPLYREEGKTRLVIAFGCTGGKHRSVTFAENMAKHLAEKGLRVRTHHRDIKK